MAAAHACACKHVVRLGARESAHHGRAEEHATQPYAAICLLACSTRQGMSIQAHASAIRSAGAKQSGQSSRAGWNRPAAEKRKDGWHPHAECDGGCVPCGPGAARRARNSCLPDGSDGAFKTMMAKLLSQKLHRTVHAVVGCKHLGERSGDCNLSGTS